MSQEKNIIPIVWIFGVMAGCVFEEVRLNHPVGFFELVVGAVGLTFVVFDAFEKAFSTGGGE